MRILLIIALYGTLCFRATAQAPIALPVESEAPRTSISLSPAVIMVRSTPGQSTTQTLTIANHTANEVHFDLAVEDVVVQEGKRSFLPPGRISNGIAATSAVSPTSLQLKAGEEATAQVTVTIPPATRQRAVVVFFRGALVVPMSGNIALNASLGTLITFNVSSDYKLETGPLQISPQTLTANVVLSNELHNTGSEPVIPKGVIAILDTVGKLVAQATFVPHRLLPGERLLFSARNPAQLVPGHYRTLSSFEFEGKVLTSAGDFTVPE